MTLFEALQPDSPYVFYSDDHGFCINTADVMDILMMDKESGYHWIPCSGDMQKDDVIYRQAAIDAEKELCLHYTPTKSVKHPHIDFVVEELERLPSAQPHWIPCSERLPKYPFRVQIQLDNGWIITGYYSEEHWYTVPHCGGFLSNDEVEAWRELPKAYGGESE